MLDLGDGTVPCIRCVKKGMSATCSFERPEKRRGPAAGKLINLIKMIGGIKLESRLYRVKVQRRKGEKFRTRTKYEQL